jgi:hypothetical protein
LQSVQVHPAVLLMYFISAAVILLGSHMTLIFNVPYMKPVLNFL